MKIKYYGHSCFRITDEERSLVFDPFGDIGYKQERITADYCVCSHKHYDHFACDSVDYGRLITAENANEYGFIKAFDSPHDDCGGAKRGRNTIFVYTSADGTTFCHMGDIGLYFTDWADGVALKIDYLALPVGGNYTIDANSAKAYCDFLKPRVIIPMHYVTARGNIDVASKDDFLSLFDKERIVKADREIAVLHTDKGLSIGLGGREIDGKIIDFDDSEF